MYGVEHCSLAWSGNLWINLPAPPSRVDTGFYPGCGRLAWTRVDEAYHQVTAGLLGAVWAQGSGRVGSTWLWSRLLRGGGVLGV